MNINDLLVKEVMIMDLKADSKEAAIDEMILSLYDHNRITNIEEFKEKILAREAQTSTGLGDGIAMPHAKTAAVNQPTVLFAKSKHGVDYAALDDQPVYLFFMIAAPEGANDTHLQALAALARLLINPEFVASLKDAANPDEVQALFTVAQEEQQKQIDKMKKMLKLKIPDSFSFKELPGLSNEVIEKLEKNRPPTLYNASLISGITPAALDIIHLNLNTSCQKQ